MGMVTNLVGMEDIERRGWPEEGCGQALLHTLQQQKSSEKRYHFCSFDEKNTIL